MARKFALIVGNSRYENAGLARLAAPDVDVRALAEVLRAPDVGGFDEVTPLLNEDFAVVSKEIARFYDQKRRDDLLLLYFSGHGVKDEQGHLYLAVRDSEPNLLAGTSIESSFITARMDSSFSKRLVLVLDCCHSGAFAAGTKAACDASVGTAAAFEGNGIGRVVLTATNSTQYASDGAAGGAETSLFTHYLIDGLKTGEADRDQDGIITVDELYDYVYEQVLNRTPTQTPGKWAFRQEGDLVIAHNRAVTKSWLPAELRETITSALQSIRFQGLAELEKLLTSHHPGRVCAARAALKTLTEDDSRKIAQQAARILEKFEQEQRREATTVTEAADDPQPAAEPREEAELLAREADKPTRAPQWRPRIEQARVRASACLAAVAPVLNWPRAIAASLLTGAAVVAAVVVFAGLPRQEPLAETIAVSSAPSPPAVSPAKRLDPVPEPRSVDRATAVVASPGPAPVREARPHVRAARGEPPQAPIPAVVPAVADTPPRPIPSDVSASIFRVLRQYELAYSGMDVSAIARLMPSSDVAQIARTFSGLRSNTLMILNPRLSVEGDVATVTGTCRVSARPKSGKEQDAVVQATFRLRRSAGSWMIETIDER